MKPRKSTALELSFLTPCLLLFTTLSANAEVYKFSYVFAGGFQSYAAGTELIGTLEGTPDPNNPDVVLVTGFGPVSYIIPDIQRHDFPSIEADEITSIRGPATTPYVTISGVSLSVSVCPSGFTGDFYPTDGILDDCPFATEGGILLETEAPFGFRFVTIADGTGNDSVCYDDVNGNTSGCRVTELGGFATPLDGTWTLTLLANVDPSVDLDPTATVGDGTQLDKGVAVGSGADLGDNVSLDQGSSVGSDTEIGSNSSLDAGATVGSNVQIGDGVSIDADVEIQDGVVIGDNVSIGRGARICSNVTIGDQAVIGRNALVDQDVPATGEIPGSHDEPAECP